MDLARSMQIVWDVEWGLGLLSLIVLIQSGQSRAFRFLFAFLSSRVFCGLFPVFIFPNIMALHLPATIVYKTYFFTYWLGFGLEGMLSFGIIADVYRQAMEPLPGLRNLGMIMFKWATAISVLLAVTVALGDRSSSVPFLPKVLTELQQTQSVLTLCLLVFVCYAIHPMGLTYRSRIFGVALGLGILSATDLVSTVAISQLHELISNVAAVDSLVFCGCALIWCVYLVLPEPRRRLILLPTNSPFFRWNQISEILGDAPGYVAVGQVGLDMFAPAELEVMRRASMKMPAA